MASPVSTNIKQECHTPPPLDQSLYTISPSHSPIPWSPSLDDRYVQNISIPQLPFPVTPSKPSKYQQSYYSPGTDTSFAISSPSSNLSTPSESNSGPSSASSASSASSPSKRIARPCNAFMLFRSEFLRKGVIPDNVESRQQNLSRVIGQVWGLMPAEQKQEWHEKSKAAAKKHAELYPDYKFTPAARGSRNTKNKVSKDGKMPEDEISRLREMYTNARGPARVVAPRSRRTKKARSVEVSDRFGSNDSGPPTGYPPLLLSSPIALHAPQPSLLMEGSSHGSSQQHQHLPRRRPSTSLGFRHYAKDGSVLATGKPAQLDAAAFNLNQDMYTIPQPYPNLDPYPTHFNTAMWTSPNYQPSQYLTSMEPISPHTVAPLGAPYNDQSSVFGPLGLTLSQGMPSVASGSQYEQAPFAVNDSSAAATFTQSMGMNADTLSFGNAAWLPEAKEMSTWDFSGYMDFPNADNVYSMGDLSRSA